MTDQFQEAARRLREADRMLRDPTHLEPGLWARCTGWLVRLGVEHALAGLWLQEAPSVATVPMRTQLIALPHYTDAATGRAAAYLWSSLSRAAHHHAYELAPTADELRTWHEEAVTLARRLHGVARTRAGYVSEDNGR